MLLDSLCILFFFIALSAKRVSLAQSLGRCNAARILKVLEATLQTSSLYSRVWWILVGPTAAVTSLWLAIGVGLPRSVRIALAWVVASMSAFWLLNRILHGLNGTPGETERDGVIWLVPPATGIIACLGLIFQNDPITQALLVLFWSLFPTTLIMILRPEIDNENFKGKHPTQAGFVCAIQSLFKYKLEVASRKPKTNELPQRPKHRFSVSCLIYYIGFALTGSALIATAPTLESLTPSQTQKYFAVWTGAIGGGIFAILAAFVTGLALTYREDQIGWKIHEGEKQILAIVYFLSTVNVIVALILGILLPLIRRMP